MEAGFIDIIKVYGPMALGWVGFAYLGKFILDRYQQDIDSRVKLSDAINRLAQLISDNHNGKAHD